MATAKDYEVTARIVAEISNPTDRMVVAKMFADAYSKENSRFNRRRFYDRIVDWRNRIEEAAKGTLTYDIGRAL